MEVATKQKWTWVATREIFRSQNLYADYAIYVGGIWEHVFNEVVMLGEAYQSDILYDVVDVGRKLASLDVEEGEEVELCLIGLRRLCVDSKAMIESRGYDSEDYDGGIYKLMLSKIDGSYCFDWYKYEGEVNE